MDSFDLEPWNMFPTDFMATDPDNLLPDDLLQQQQQQHQEQQPQPTINNIESSVNVEVLGDVKSEPMDCQTVKMVGEEIPEPDACVEKEMDSPPEKAEMTTAKQKEEYDDNEIFNFGLEEPTAEAKVNEDIDPISDTSGPILRQRDKLISHSLNETAINYESAVVYICPACGAEFDVQTLWKLHMNGTHNYNTRRGLNFVQIDKLYHRCLECHKRIAMHAMENLLKHKFTHLPFRCTKCKICLRHYKYRQDLMVHLRTVHRDELLALTLQPNAVKAGSIGGSKTEKHSGGLEIMDIKENAIDIFESTCDVGVKVKNELLDDNDDVVCEGNVESLANTSANYDSEIPKSLQVYMIHVCPKCGAEHNSLKEWCDHIDIIHNYNNTDGLNIQLLPNKEAQCVECNQTLTSTTVQAMQRHKFSHLPHNATLRCKLCRQLFTDQREIIRHLLHEHCLGDESHIGNHWSESSHQLNEHDDVSCDDKNFDDDEDDQMLFDTSSKNEERDMYEPHIEYLCPQCGRDFYEKKQWRRHIVKRHQLTDLNVLNFMVVGERQVMCLECKKIITNAYGVQNAQQHRITHMPYKAYIRCRLCVKAYTDRKGLVKHLRSVHSIRPDSMRQRSSLRVEKQMHMQAMPQLQSRPTSQTAQSQSTGQMRQSQQQLHRKRLKQPIKEIVRHEQYTYEIQYLDDDETDNTIESDSYQYNDAGGGNYDEYDDNTLLQLDDTPVPELLFDNCNRSNNGTTKQELNRAKRRNDDYLDYERQKSRRWEQQDIRRFVSCDSNSKSVGVSNQKNKHSSFQHDRRKLMDDTYDDTQNSNDTDDMLLIPSLPAAASDNRMDDSHVGSSTMNRCNDSGVALPRMDSSNFEQYFSFLCPECGIEYKTQFDWRRHINNVHHFDKRHHLGFRPIDKNRFQCSQCHMVFVNTKLKSLQEHKFRHLSYKLYIKCQLCGTCYNHKPNMINHLRLRHNITMPAAAAPSIQSGGIEHKHNVSPAALVNKVPKPSVSSKSSSSSINLNQTFYNSAVDHESIAYFCPQCNANFDSHVNWRQHIVAEHNLNSRYGLNFRQIDEHHFLCLQCYKRVTVTHNKGAIGQLQSHKFRHLPYKSFHCLACGVQFVRKQMFFKHLNKKTKRCNAASKISSNNKANKNARDIEHSELQLQLHQRDQDQPISKAIRASTSTSNNITNAELPSSAQKGMFVLLCPDCGVKFDTWGSWREHINIIHDLGKRDKLRFRKFGASQHQCIDCRELVAGKKLRDLQSHRFKHLPYGLAYMRCGYCAASYQSKRALQQHFMQMHSNLVTRKITKVERKDDNEEEDDEEEDEDEDEEKNIITPYDDDNTNTTNNTTTTTTTTAAVVNESSSETSPDDDDDDGDGDDDDYNENSNKIVHHKKHLNFNAKQGQEDKEGENSMNMDNQNKVRCHKNYDADDDNDTDTDHRNVEDDDDNMVAAEPTEFVEYSDADEQYLLG